MMANDNANSSMMGLSDKKNSQLEYIYWYIGDEKYFPSYPPVVLATAKEAAAQSTYANLLTIKTIGTCHACHISIYCH